MKKCFLIALIVISTTSFADEGEKWEQLDVYDGFRQFSTPLADEEVTAQIKRHMANLLYPVDMSSFSKPDNDPKFRDLIMALQQQMGVSPTGILTMDQFKRLEIASRNVDRQFVGVPFPINVNISSDGASADGARIMDVDAWSSAVGDRMPDFDANKLTFARILCFRARGICEMYTAKFHLDDPFLFLELGIEYQINTWTPSRVTARLDAPCSSSLMTMDAKARHVMAVTEPKPNCTGFTPIAPWHLVDGFSVASKLHLDRINPARALVYRPAQRLMPLLQK
jgi:hypothetical protein